MSNIKTISLLNNIECVSSGHLYYHLCPLLGGLGLTLCLQATIRAMLNLAVLMWSTLTFYHLFNNQVIVDDFFKRIIVNQGDSSLESLGELGGHQTLALSIVCVSVFILTSGENDSLQSSRLTINGLEL